MIILRHFNPRQYLAGPVKEGELGLLAVFHFAALQ
jgi:hypothetical protein